MQIYSTISNNLINLNDKFWLVPIVNIANEFPYLGTNETVINTI